MLRVQTKENCIRILRDVLLLCQKGLKKDDAVTLSVLQESQAAIISVGNELEVKLDDAASIVSMLENLCETFYTISLDLENKASYVDLIAGLLEQIIEAVSELDTCYQVVFFPYKADMWDSMESIYFACKEDARCDCKVVPIPYYHFDSKKNEWIYCHEMDRFPSEIPVVNYTEYSLDEKPDAAFVHNPYDEYNLVTHVHSDYYSHNLKKYVKNLFYVPYYVTSGFISQDQKLLSVYQNADYLVVQSESFKEGLKDHNFDHKAIVMGSPKLDRVIRLSGKKDMVPAEWQEALNGKKALMLNTSLGQFLHDGEAYLEKIAYIFDKVAKRDDVAIVWRPHPLLVSTIESMRPHLLTPYLELKRTFEEKHVGVFDTTPDISNTVAIVDGYIGETSSSVVNLFEAAGKPLFILNNYILDDMTEDEKRDLLFTDCQMVDGVLYCSCAESRDIYKVEDSDWENISKKAQIEDVVKWMPVSTRGTMVGSNIYFAPIWSEEFQVYDIKENRVREISAIGEKKILNYRAAVSYKNKVFYIPNVTKCIMEYDTKTSKWQEYKEPIQALQKGVNETIFEDVFGYFEDGNALWMTTMYSNRVLRFDMETGKHHIYEIGSTSMRYSAIAEVDNRLYLSDANTGNITVCDVDTNRIVNEYAMPRDYQVFRNVQGRSLANWNLMVTGECLITIPFTSKGMVKVDLKTGVAERIATDFWADVFEPVNNYKKEAHGVISFAKMIDDNTLLVQKRRDASLLELNVHTGEYKVHHPKLAPGELEELLDGEDGFEKSYTNGEFARRESRYFSFDSFLDDLVSERLGDVMARQKKEMDTMAVNLDGTCGEKVHAFMMDVLTQK